MATSDITSLVIETKSKGVTDAAKALSTLSTSADTAEKRIASLTVAMGKLNEVSKLSASAVAQTNSLISALKQTSSANDGMSAAVNQNKQKLIEQKREMELFNTSARAYSAAHAEAIKMNQALDVAQKTATTGMRHHNNAMREANGLARGLSGSLGALWMTYGAFTGLAVGIAIGASLKGIVTIGKDVEHTLEGIRVRGNETVASIDAIRESVFELGKGVYGPQAVANAFQTLVLAGLKAEQAISSISAALNLATVGGVSIEKAATTLVSVGTAIGFTAEGFSRVGDVIAKTAALSMSSVETLSEAFKSASSVNRLYGVSLEDIGTSLGILSNLGIQGSAAGTALKNMFKELASEADKVQGTFKDMGLSADSFKNADGKFKPLLEVIQTLDEGLKKLSKKEQDIAIARISNERGLRLLTQALGEYNTMTSEGGNALERFRKNVENSYGFAAKGAVQMALTAKSQIDSMFNTLKTSFAETFSSVQPEIIAFSARMKQAFGSKEFKDGLITLAQGFAKMALAIAENIPLITKFVVGLVAIKAAMISAAVWQAAAAGVTMVGTAMAALSAGTLTLTVALPALAVVLGTLAVAWTAYNLAKGEDTQKQAKDAQAYASGYISGLIKEAENLDKVNQKMRERKTLKQANDEIERDDSRQKMVELDNKAVREAEANVNKLKGTWSFNSAKLLQDQTAAQTALNKARENAANNTKLAAAAEATLFAKAKENADLAKAQADASRAQGDTAVTAALAGKTDPGAINDKYRTSLTLIRGEIELGKREMQSFEASITAQYKAGLITEFDKIEQISAARSKMLIENVQKYQRMIDTASPANKGNVRALAQNDMQAAQWHLEDEAINRHNQMLTATERLEEETFLSNQRRLTLEGKNEQAAVEKANRLYRDKIEAAQKYLDAQLEIEDALADLGGNAEVSARVALTRANLQAMRSQGAGLVFDGKATDAANEANKALNEMRAKIDAITGAVPSGGIFAGIVAQEDIEKLRTATIPELERLYQAMWKIANAPGANPSAMKDVKLFGEELAKVKKNASGYNAFEGAQSSLTKFVEEGTKQGEMLGGVMSNAFKGAEDSLVSFIQTGKMNFKSLADSIISDLLRIQIRQAMASAVGGASGGSPWVSALTSIVGAVVGAGASNTTGAGNVGFAGGGTGATNYSLGNGMSSSGNLGSGLQFRAAGGPVNAGESYIVGEKGMEIFEPTVSGNIIPNHALGTAKGASEASTTTVNFSPVIQIDSRTDQAQVAQLVNASIKQSQGQLVELLQRQGRI